MSLSSRLAATAIVGVIAGSACAAGPHAPATSAATVSSEKNGCGHHAPGACAAPDPSPRPTNAPVQPPANVPPAK
jgi:hypothetical protein